MDKKLLFLAFIAVLLGCLPYSQVHGQVKVDTLSDPMIWVDNFIGSGIKVRNVRLKGNSVAAAWFDNIDAKPHFSNGILLSTGLAANACKPNMEPKTGTVNYSPGDRNLTAIGDNRTFDAVSLEFEFMAQYDSITFNFFFGSEEYNEFVGNTFGDAFGIFVNGPGCGNGINLALVPGKNEPITINTVNVNKNKEYYLDNNPFNLAGLPLPEKRKTMNQTVLNNLAYDGYTTVFHAGMKVKPREVYNIRFVITDVGDALYDSGLFLEGGSFASLEQAWRVRRRLEIAERIREDSIRMADSLAALALRQAEDASFRAKMVEDSIHRADSIHAAEEAYRLQQAQIIKVNPPVKPQGPVYRTAPGPSDTIEYKVIINFPEGEMSPDPESEKLLQAVATHLATHPNLRVGLYPKSTPDEGNKMADLRERTVRYYFESEKVSEKRIFRNGFSFLNPGETAAATRVELWIRHAE